MLVGTNARGGRNEGGHSMVDVGTILGGLVSQYSEGKQDIVYRECRLRLFKFLSVD